MADTVPITPGPLAPLPDFPSWTEIRPSESWGQIAKRLGGSQASQKAKDHNVLYLIQANGGVSTAEPTRAGRIIFYIPSRMILTTPAPQPAKILSAG